MTTIFLGKVAPKMLVPARLLLNVRVAPVRADPALAARVLPHAVAPLLALPTGGLAMPSLWWALVPSANPGPRPQSGGGLGARKGLSRIGSFLSALGIPCAASPLLPLPTGGLAMPLP